MPAPLAIVVLGLFLGMRHATDPDHVVAVTTIVSREKTMLHAAIIGAFWGVGHTATILAVGAAIILLKLTIPPALGLTMELAVALMLILLGVLNLTGLLRKGMDWLAIRGYRAGAHAHIILGRSMIHSHAAGRFSMAARGTLPRAAAPSWPQSWKDLGLFHIVRLGFRGHQPVLRTLLVLPDWDLRWAVHGSPELDASLKFRDSANIFEDR
jgi:hypothetical protein